MCKVITPLLLVGICACKQPPPENSATLPDEVHLTRAALQDKINGGWACQASGGPFGGPTDFRLEGTMINDDHPIVGYHGYIRKTMEQAPRLYDDLYMDLTFVEVFEREGLD